MYFYTAEHYSCCSCEPSHSESCWDRRCGPELLWTSVGETNVQNAGGSIRRNKVWHTTWHCNANPASSTSLNPRSCIRGTRRVPRGTRPAMARGTIAEFRGQHATTSTAMTIKDTKCISRYQDMHSPVWIEKTLRYDILVLRCSYGSTEIWTPRVMLLKDAERLNWYKLIKPGELFYSFDCIFWVGGYRLRSLKIWTIDI